MCLPNRHGQCKAQRSSESHKIYGITWKSIFPAEKHTSFVKTHHPTVWESDDTILHVLAVLQAVWRTNTVPWCVNAFAYCSHSPFRAGGLGELLPTNTLWGRTISDLQSRFYDSNPRQHWMAINYTITEYVLYLYKIRKFNFIAKCGGPVTGREQCFAGKHCYTFSMVPGKAALRNLNAVLVIYFLLFLFSLVIKCNKKLVLYC